MRSAVLAVLSAVLLLGALPAGAATETSDVACPDNGRERLTLEGGDTTFEAPAPAPVLTATAEFLAPFGPYRRALWHYQADLAPAAAGTVSMELTWDNAAHDYDIFVYDDEDFELARSVDENPQTGVAREAVTFPIGHCESFTVAVTNFAGAPRNALQLTTAVEPAGGATLRCAENDTARNCQGKAPGEAPDAPQDARSIYYLGGDIGQGSMVHTQQGAEEVPFRSALTTERPTGAVPNTYVAPPVGFNAYRNPLQAYWGTEFDEPRAIAGDAHALVWVGSETMKEGGTLFAQLFADGSKVGEVEIAGADIGSGPTPLWLTFPDVDVPDAYDVTLQLSTEPVASSNGTTSDPGNATFTVYYDSVQFPSRLTLP